MTAWSKDELRKMAAVDDLHIAPFREDGAKKTPQDVAAEVVSLVRERIGAVPSFKTALVVDRMGG